MSSFDFLAFAVALWCCATGLVRAAGSRDRAVDVLMLEACVLALAAITLGVWAICKEVGL